MDALLSLTCSREGGPLECCLHTFSASFHETGGAHLVRSILETKKKMTVSMINQCSGGAMHFKQRVVDGNGNHFHLIDSSSLDSFDWACTGS